MIKKWGVPVYDYILLFEFLILEWTQAGLSYSSILKKCDDYRRSYDNFSPIKIASYDKAKEQELLQNEGIIRNRLKIVTSITNDPAIDCVKHSAYF